MGGKKLLGLALCLVLALWLATPVFAQTWTADAKQELAKASPKRHPYLFSTIGGAAIGAGIGAILGGGNDITKGLLIGGGGASSMYLHSHRRTGGRLRPWQYLASHTALGAGIGWTVCGCNDGLLGGTLFGAGADLVWQTMTPGGRRATTAAANPSPSRP
ncbi:MAG: hypothetical protein ACE14L_17390 [Terriglobales bacterium]